MDAHVDICKAIAIATGQDFVSSSSRDCKGGCIHQAQWLEGACGRAFFVKTNGGGAVDMFAAEAAGLNALRATQTMRVPAVIAYGQTNTGTAYIVLEAIAMGGRGRWERMGQQLAAMHRVTGDFFGWDTDNFIGRTPQRNGHYRDWVSFFREQRLGYQFELAARNGLSIPESTVLLDCLDKFFAGYAPQPSLLHGDLWSGNASFTEEGEPVMFDPAAYYGDRETDIAFTAMFGGFDPAFYQGYASIFPLHPGFAQRQRLYNLYHELNHYNLFGGSYGAQARNTVSQLLRWKKDF